VSSTGIRVLGCVAATVAFSAMAQVDLPALSPEFRALVERQQKRKHPDVPLQRLLPFAHPPVRAPVGDGVQLRVPRGLGNTGLARWGLVDVTATPFSADPSGQEDATGAIQSAIDFARDHQMVTFFPPGNYRISGTLTCTQNYYLRQNGAINGAPNFPCVLMGSRKDPRHRARLVLAPLSQGFGSSDEPRFVVHYTNRSIEKHDPHMPQANISFSQLFVDLDIVIGEGNPGAIGIRIQAAEGSGLQNVHIDATHGLGGMRGAPGSGGYGHNLTVLGGEFGIDTRGWPPEFRKGGTGTQPTPTLSTVRLLDQRGPALINKSRGPLIGVGWEIRCPHAGPAIRVERGYRSAPFNGSLALIDSRIEFTGQAPGELCIETQRSVLLYNVYVRGARKVFPSVTAAPSAWTCFPELAHPVGISPFKGYRFEETIRVDGRRQDEAPWVRKRAEPPPDDLLTRHGLGEQVPSWEDPGVVNVKDAPYGARGDSVTDDTAALQRAIVDHDVVFLPKGYYRVSRPLQLRANTRLFGVAPHLATIMARGSTGAFGDGANPRPLVDTPDAPDAGTVLAYLQLMVAIDHRGDGAGGGSPGHYALRWRCGRKSVVRNVQFLHKRLTGFAHVPREKRGNRQPTHPMVDITANGGGRWYGFFMHGYRDFGPGYRHLRVHNTTGQPLAFYHLHAQYAPNDTQCEFRNARQVTVYGVKTEYQSRFLDIIDCDHICIFGHGGNATAAPGSAHYIVRNVPNFLISNLGDQVWLGKSDPHPTGSWVQHWHLNLTEFHPLIDVLGSTQFKFPSVERPLLYRRGTPRVSPGMGPTP
jgi:hypothetical protein